MTPPLFEERLPRNLHKFAGAGGGAAASYSSPDSLDHHPTYCRTHGSGRLAGAPKLPEPSAATAEASAGHSARTSGSAEDDLEREWVEQDEPGVYITIRALAGGGRELRRVRFR